MRCKANTRADQSLFLPQWNGTIDWSAFLAITEALDYRERIGGERRINQYCHQLAIDGGELVAKILGTETMRNKKDDDGELVANMVRRF